MRTSKATAAAWAVMLAVSGSAALAQTAAPPPEWVSWTDERLAGWVESSTDWQSQEPALQARIATRLQAMGGAGRAARVKMVEFLTGCLADPVKTGSLGASWSVFARMLEGELSADLRGQWAKKIHANFASNGTALRAMNNFQVQGLGETLKSLGNAQGTDLVARWVEVSAAWELMPVDFLATISGYLPGLGEGGKAAQAKMAAFVQAKYLPDPEKMRAYTVANWASLTNGLSGGLTAAEKGVWVGKIHTAFASDAASLSKIGDYGTVLRMVDSLKSIGDPRAEWTVAEWVDKSAGQRMSLAELLSLCGGVGKVEGDAGRAARAKLIEKISQRMADGAAVREVGPLRFSQALEPLGEGMTAEAKAAWATKARQAYTGEAAGLNALADQVLMGRLIEALTALGDGQAGTVRAEWVEKSPAVSEMPLTGLLSLNGELAKLGERGGPARAKLVERMLARMNDAAMVRQVGLTGWGKAAEQLGGALTAQAKTEWVGKIHAAYAGDETALNAMTTYSAVLSVVSGLKGMGDPQGATVLADWVIKSVPASQLPLAGQLSLIEELNKLGEPGQAARAKLVERITAQMADASAVRQVGLTGWAKSAEQLGGSLTAQAKAEWIGKVHAAYAGDETALNGLQSHSAVQTVISGLKGLGDPRADQVLNDWVEKSNPAASLSISGLTALAGDLAKLGDSGQAARRAVIGRIHALCGDATGLDSLETVQAVQSTVSALALLGDPQAGTVLTDWVEKSSAVVQLPLSGLVGLGGDLSKLGDGGRAARVKVVAQIGGRLTDGEQVRKMGLALWGQALAQFAGELTAEAKAQWVGRIHAGYAGDVAALNALSSYESVAGVVSGLRALGDPQAGQVLADWVEVSAAASALPLSSLTSMAGELVKLGDGAQAARAKLLAQITAQMNDAARVRQVGVSGWEQFLRQGGGELTAETKTAWVGKLRAAFVSDAAALDGLVNVDQAKRLGGVLQTLGDSRAAEVYPAWVEKSNAFKSTPAGSLPQIASDLAALGAPGKVARLRMIEWVTSQHLSDPAKVRVMSVGQWAELARRLSPEMPVESRQLWASKLQAAFTDSSGQVTLGLADAIKALTGGTAVGRFRSWSTTQP